MLVRYVLIIMRQLLKAYYYREATYHSLVSYFVELFSKRIRYFEEV